MLADDACRYDSVWACMLCFKEVGRRRQLWAAAPGLGSHHEAVTQEIWCVGLWWFDEWISVCDQGGFTRRVDVVWVDFTLIRVYENDLMRGLNLYCWSNWIDWVKEWVRVGVG